MYRSSPDFRSEGSWATVVPESNGPVGAGAVQTTSSVPRNSSRLLTAYQRPSRVNTLRVCDTPCSAGISSAAFPGDFCQRFPSQYCQPLLSSSDSARVRATRSENPKIPFCCGRAVP